MGWSI